jgi:hypothetical protein
MEHDRHSWWSWVAPDPALGLEARLFQWITLVYALGAIVFVMPANYFQHMPLLLHVAVGAFAAIAFVLWWQARRGAQRPTALFVAYSATLSVAWFFNEGSGGSCLMYFMLALTIPVVFCRGRRRLTLIALYVVDIFALFWLEHRYPDWVVPYATPLARRADLIVSLFISTSALALIVWVVVAGYLEERARLVDVNARLTASLDEVRTLRGLLPICSWCRKVRDDAGLWTQIEQYISAHTGAEFTHGMCPECYERGLLELNKS